MMSFEPVAASQKIKEGFIDYITTSFDLADPVYRDNLRKQLLQPGYIAKGPYLELSGSYKTGRSISNLIEAGIAAPLFQKLEPIADKERELKLDRPLYFHQERALCLANEGHNLVVTTGTGSGKTECFLIPIINHLLREQEQGPLKDAVQAIVIYPMNALANDQMKRMRALLKGYPEITFGLYNGNTRHKESDARKAYSEAHDGNAPISNELISREIMQKTPPHILITNYSMLEYMMLRPKDDKVISGAKLRFIVLDEAHIYRGTTGMETAMLMRRLRARLDRPDLVRYILTSATLGGRDADGDIVTFAENLCGVPFQTEHIIRSQETLPAMLGEQDYPKALFTALARRTEPVTQILERYQIVDPCPEGDEKEKLFSLLLGSRIFAKLVEHTRQPKTLSELCQELLPYLPLSEKELTDLITICVQAERGKSNLLRARYHYFVRTLEGAYITLGKEAKDKQLFLHRKESFLEDGQRWEVFEAAVCSDCGRLAVTGRESQEGYLRQVARKTEADPKECSYYLLKNEMDEVLETDESEDDEEQKEDGNFVLCSRCGKLGTRADLQFGTICDCENPYYAPVIQTLRTKSGRSKCPACGFGHFRSFYLGSEAATAVLGTELFDQLPDQKLDLQATIKARQEARAIQEDVSNPFRRLNKPTASPTITEHSNRQFLCFSDSRSEAAFFASYMERSYEEFLRRRGMWKVVEEMKASGETRMSVPAFVERLIHLFDCNETFQRWDPDKKVTRDSLHQESKRNAWIAVMNEMYNARRGTSLPSLGVLSFSFPRNAELAEALSENYDLPVSDLQALLDLLVMDGVYSGAVSPGHEYALTDYEREYIFFTPVEQALTLVKTDGKQKNITSWAGRKRENGNYYPNTRLQRLTRSLNLDSDTANTLLRQYWSAAFDPSADCYMLDASDFTIRVAGDSGLKFYRCKKCGRLTSYFVKDQCAYGKCDGMLYEINPEYELKDNHYAKLYQSQHMTPLRIKEHTAQLTRDHQTSYQEAFVKGAINALSCSTTFEMGVDVGSLETVYMRNVPPNPSNYVQRAGRAGRGAHAAAFVLTYVKLSSHDLTFYQNPAKIISGQIQAPIFAIQNEKVVRRHIYAVALSKFFAAHPDDVYDGNNQSVFLNGNGYELLKDYLSQKPDSLKQILQASIPKELHQSLGINDFSWVEELIGEDGVLEIAVREFRDEVKELEKAFKQCEKEKDHAAAARAERALQQFRCDKEKDKKQRPKQLIDFLARNNVLPKYGFPVDTVELQIRASGNYRSFNRDSLQLSRDLQMAIAEYAPGAQVIADGHMYTSRYIRRLPTTNGGKKDSGWEIGYYAVCPDPDCQQRNFTQRFATKKIGGECVACGKKIPGPRWQRTLEPRRGFWAETTEKEVPLHKPVHDFKTEDCYVGDLQHKQLQRCRFRVNGMQVEMESTANDSLVVLSMNSYYVCPICGYAVDSKKEILGIHKDARGYDCRYNREEETHPKEYRLSHTFKTDVAKITFETSEAQEQEVMLSVLYAILEGVSRALDIERTDIKGCLHAVQRSICQKPIYELILYDAVAGGAGHMRRLVTEDASVFRRILNAALRVVENCSCDPSCYQCIRNYYNQRIHDILDRKKAAKFLRQWIGEYAPIAIESLGPKQDNAELPFQVENEERWEDYGTWDALREETGLAELERWDISAVPGIGCLVLPTLRSGDEVLKPCFLWPAAKVIVFENPTEFEHSALLDGWHCFAVTVNPKELKSACEEA